MCIQEKKQEKTYNIIIQAEKDSEFYLNDIHIYKYFQFMKTKSYKMKVRKKKFKGDDRPRPVSACKTW